MKINHHQSLLRNLLYSLVLFGQIKTTRAKAKAMGGLIDRLVNKIKKGTVAARREVLQSLPQKEIVEKLTRETIPSLGNRTSGFTRIIKVGQRQGDGAPMVIMEWVNKGVTEENKENQENEGNKETNEAEVPKKHVKTNKTKSD